LQTENLRSLQKPLRPLREMFSTNTLNPDFTQLRFITSGQAPIHSAALHYIGAGPDFILHYIGAGPDYAKASSGG
jgi:hypothetical protein